MPAGNEAALLQAPARFPSCPWRHPLRRVAVGFTDIYTYDLRQTDAAVALGLKPLKA